MLPLICICVGLTSACASVYAPGRSRSRVDGRMNTMNRCGQED